MNEKLSVCTFYWKPHRLYRSQFGPENVNILARMTRLNYPHPHDFVCFTDDPKGIDPSLVKIVPLWKDLKDVPSPWGPKGPSCYRRLKLFSSEGEALAGNRRFVVLDLDCVIVQDMTPVWDRSESFVIWGDTTPNAYYNGSMILMSANARPQIWDDFDPVVSPAAVAKAGLKGSDQGWISYKLGRGEPMWTTADGVFSYRLHVMRRQRAEVLPDKARIVFFHGQIDPWSPEPMRLDWVRKHYR